MFVNRCSTLPIVATQSERRAQTLTAVLAAARERFGTSGFDATSIDDIAHEANATKGAVYHYYATKEHLFRAVFESIEAEVAERVSAVALREASPHEMLRAGCRVFLRSALDERVRRVLFIDGPRVLGWETWREIDEQFFLAMVRAAIELEIGSTAIASLRSHLLVGAIDEAVMVIANSSQPQRALPVVIEELDAVIAAVLRSR